MLKFVIISWVTACFLTPVTPYSYEGYEEGPCENVQYKSQAGVNDDLLLDDSELHFTSAGSKYHLYRITVGVPNHKQISEEDFLHNACIVSSYNANAALSQLSAFGLNNIGNLQINATGTDGVTDVVYLDIPGQPVARHTVTLTDNESYYFFTVCWLDTQERGWGITSTKSTLDPHTKKLIIDHATSSGFDPANFVIVPDGSCRYK